jgi:cytochrome c peroxidase
LAALADAGIATPTVIAAESTAMIELGRNLFFDKLISGNRNMACASCHHPTAGTGDDLPLSLGEGATGVGAGRTAGNADQVIARNAPPLFALGAQGVDSMFWDSRVRRDAASGELQTPEPLLNGATPTRADMAEQLTTALAAQAMFPPTSADEMRGDPGENELADAATNEAVWALIMARLVGTADGTVGGVAAYRTLFAAAFPTVINFDTLTFAHAARAIAAFEASTWAFVNAPLDRYLAGDTTALSNAAKRGAALFTGRARCARCHSGPMLSDSRHHALAVPQLGPGAGGEADDRGLALETGDPNDNYRFRTPPLRNVTQTGPWFHDGAFSDLGSVVRHYRNPGDSLLNYDPAANLPAFFEALVDTDVTRNQARIAAVSPIVGTGIRMNGGEIADLVAFLQALEDPAAVTPVAVPATVASGLAVD